MTDQRNRRPISERRDENERRAMARPDGQSVSSPRREKREEKEAWRGDGVVGDLHTD